MQSRHVGCQKDIEIRIYRVCVEVPSMASLSSQMAAPAIQLGQGTGVA